MHDREGDVLLRWNEQRKELMNFTDLVLVTLGKHFFFFLGWGDKNMTIWMNFGMRRKQPALDVKQLCYKCLCPSRKALTVLSTMPRKCCKREAFCSVEKLSNFKLK